MFSLWQRTLPLRIVNPSPGRPWARMTDVSTPSIAEKATEEAAPEQAKDGSPQNADTSASSETINRSLRAHERRTLEWNAPEAWRKAGDAVRSGRYTSSCPSEYSDHMTTKLAPHVSPVLTSKSSLIMSPTFSSSSASQGLDLQPPKLAIGQSYEITSFIEGESLMRDPGHCPADQTLVAGARSSTNSRQAGSPTWIARPSQVAQPRAPTSRRTLSEISDIETSELRDFLIHDGLSAGSTASWKEISQAQVQRAFSGRRV